MTFWHVNLIWEILILSLCTEKFKLSQKWKIVDIFLFKKINQMNYSCSKKPATKLNISNFRKWLIINIIKYTQINKRNPFKKKLNK